MILRRLVDSLKQQHWIGVAIELLIVILGVFIGTQVSNWNDDRLAAEKSAVFTVRLKNDLVAEDWGVRLLGEYDREVLANVGRALRDRSGQAPLSDDQFLVSTYRASQYAYLIRNRTTYDELVATGEIGLITDPDLRQTATLVFSTPVIDRIADEGRRSEYRRLFRRSVPPEVQAELLRRCGDRIRSMQEPLTHVLDYPCTLDLPADEVSAAARALRADASLVPTLRLQSADLQTNLTDLQYINPAISSGLRRFTRRAP